MIDPLVPYGFNRSVDELWEWFIFSALVAGKNADTQARKLRELFDRHGDFFHHSKFTFFTRTEHDIRRRLEDVGVGQYTRLTRLFRHLNCHMLQMRDPLVWSRNELVKLPGVGLKTASMYRMYAFAHEEVAALDVHILRFLSDMGVDKVPQQTPTALNYYRLEEMFIKETKRLHVRPWVLDIWLWQNYRQHVYYPQVLTGLPDFATSLEQDPRFARHVYR